MPEHFTWIKTYEAIANAVYQYRDRRNEFFELFCELFDINAADGKMKFPGNGG